MECTKENEKKTTINYREFFEKVETLWPEINQRDETKAILYAEMDRMLGDDKTTHRSYKYWFAEPVKHLWEAGITEKQRQFRAWVMISALQKATLAMIKFYENLISQTQPKLLRAIAQLQAMEGILKSVSTLNTESNA